MPKLTQHSLRVLTFRAAPDTLDEKPCCIHTCAMHEVTNHGPEGRYHIAFYVPLPEPIAVPEQHWYSSGHMERTRQYIEQVRAGRREELAQPRFTVIQLTAHQIKVRHSDPTGYDTLMSLARRLWSPEVLGQKQPWRSSLAARREAMRIRLVNLLLRGTDPTHVMGIFPLGVDQRGKSEPIPRSAREVVNDNVLRARDMTVIEATAMLESEFEPPTRRAGRITDSPDLFDDVMRYIQALQQAYNMIKPVPITLCRDETLPIMVPYVIYRHDQPGVVRPVAGPGFIMSSPNLPGVRDDRMTAASETVTAEVLEQTYKAVVQGHPLITYFECAREARGALANRGDTRTCVIMCAAASESLFDAVLYITLWEDGLKPEDAGSFFNDRRGIKHRVRNHYHPRLRGDWNLDRPGPLRRWDREIEAIRHRCVHGGYVPDSETAQMALQVLQEVESFLWGRLKQPPTLARYPITNLAIFGPWSLQREGLLKGMILEAYKAHEEIDLRQRFNRWRKALERVRLAYLGQAQPPSETRAFVCASIWRAGGIRWFIHDPEAGMARPIETPVPTSDVDPEETAFYMAEKALHQSDKELVTIVFTNSEHHSKISR